MAERYFNLKIGSEKVNGAIIRVNSNEADLEKRIHQFCAGVSSYKFKELKKEREEVTYELEIPNVRYVPMEGIPTPVEAGPSIVMGLRVSSTGGLSLDSVPEGVKVYLSEVSKERAEKLKEEAECFELLRAYVFE